MLIRLLVLLACLRLGASRVSNEEFAALAKHVYDTSSTLPEHMQDQWSVVKNMSDPQIDFHASLYSKGPSNEVVMAVRGTHTLQNFLVDDLQILWGNMPPIAEKVADELRQLSKEHNSIYLTGHSLGAAAVNTAFAKLTLSHEDWLERIAGVVLFENPGIQDELVDELSAKLTEAKFKTLRSKITEFFGAPNPVNMVASHIASAQFRVLIDHGRQVNFKHGATCLLKSAGRATLWYYAANYAAKQVASFGTFILGSFGITSSESSSNADSDQILSSLNSTLVASPLIFSASSFATWAPQFGLLSTFLGLQGSQLVDWVQGQHSMTSMHEAFGQEEDKPHGGKYIRMESWPSGVTLRSTVMRLLLNIIPFHPANDGIHTCHDPDGVLERRISMIQGYVTKE